MTSFQDIDITALTESPWNPRKHYDQAKLEELAASIREKGVIEPLVVRANGKPGAFEILAGSRRFRASKIAGLTSLPAVVRVIDDTAALELAVIENGQREDVHPLDEAEGYRALMNADKHYTVAVVAAKVGKSESYVYRRMKLLELEGPLLTALAEDRLSIAHAEKLLRLTPALRKEAADPETGVVWRRSPLLEYGEKWVPQRDDLRPLNELENFIRTRSHFDPSSQDARHFQPDLAEQLAEFEVEAHELAYAGDDDQDEAADAAVASLIELSVDPMARMRLHAKPNEKIPLTPSKWREIKGDKDRCEFAQRGVVTHGGPTRILEVCTKRSCRKHFPVAKKKAKARAAAPAKPKGETYEQRYAREEAERRAKQQAWAALLATVGPAFAKATAGVKFGAALVREVLEPHAIKVVEKYFGVALTDKTAAHVMLLTSVRTYNRECFLADIKPYKTFNFGAVEQKYKAAQKTAAPATGAATKGQSVKGAKKR